jgi:hypothetical protein
MSTAAAVARLGVSTILVTASDASATPVGAASFAWVNAHRKAPGTYRLLNEEARTLHAERSATHEQPWFTRTGATADGIDYRDDGYVDTAAYLAAQRADLLTAGGEVRTDVVVDDIEQLRADLDADAVIVAAGTGTAALIGHHPAAAARVASSTGLNGFCARIELADHPIDQIVSVDGLQLRPDGTGRIATQSLRIERELRERGVAASVATVWPALQREIAAACRWELPSDAPVRIDHAHRPTTRDGLPVVGWVGDGVYVALTHSGVTLAPLLAEIVASDLVEGDDERLTPFRP